MARAAKELAATVRRGAYYDLAKPLSATEYVMAHLCLPPGLGARIEMKYYEAGHMMYVHPPSMAKMKRDLDAFIDSTTRP